MAAVLVWVLIVASAAVCVGVLVALWSTLAGLWRQLRGDTREH
ncbi:hypothetical protein [Tessaracoccus lapidicaptus]|nr:hypothetical protein [Tessaracoccus lapidicaptus]